MTTATRPPAASALDQSVNETAPRSECRPTLKNALTQPRLLEMDVKSATWTLAGYTANSVSVGLLGN